MKILIVDDEESITTLLEYNLNNQGYETMVAHDGKEALELYRANHFDLLIVDLMLPKIDGITLTKKIREQHGTTLILMLTALGTKKDVIKGLNAGADDYLIKPFDVEEMLARVAALLRRVQTDITSSSRFTVKENFVTLPNGQTVGLTKKESELFNYLHTNRNQILSRDQIMANVWPEDSNSGRVVDIQISHLREKIETDAKKPQFLKTIRGFGYRLEE
ncbi:response regulator transcription factor [Lactobacillus sp. YT155]|uniref:response regulator transcription factor n=1 Tax=Lactobacillus sp. YT155 TaxID=3060955 RepID=UPI00265F44D6|nr:response regulator transcription factor [Lactobacillus sp. YT155]MDO1605126.1 response regulator transcription factor [Lactobacillus sp. YT155]